MIPHTLHNMTAFVDGASYAGRVKSVEVPGFTLATEEFRGGGMDVPVEIDVGMAAMTSKATFLEWSADLFRLFGLVDGADKEVVFRGSMERGQQAVPVVFTQRGIMKSTPAGTWEAGTLAEAEFEFALRYAELSIDGATVIKIDAENMIREINGTDQLSARRAALGL